MRVTIQKTNGPRVPALLIGNATQALIEDVFARKDVFRGAQRISKRIVVWGSRGSASVEPVELPHSAVVIPEQDLVDRLGPPESGARHRDSSPTHQSGDIKEWTLAASRPVPTELAQVKDRHFGSRVARASAVQLRKSCALDACWIESLERGWLFLLPGLAAPLHVGQAVSPASRLYQSPRRGWLLSVGGPAEELLTHSRMVSAQIESLDSPLGQFPAYPRISDPLCGSGISDPRGGDGWLACGTAAMAFDPICGDGTGNAIREAILASAVIRAMAKHAQNDQQDALLAHFRTRLIAGFLKHLELCRQFYAACSGEWWAAELDRLDEGIAWCRAQLGGEPKFRYRLRGFDLEPVSE
jgi:hypothetical protein